MVLRVVKSQGDPFFLDPAVVIRHANVFPQIVVTAVGNGKVVPEKFKVKNK